MSCRGSCGRSSNEKRPERERAAVALTAGTARTAITPPVGIPLSGFVGRGVATDVHDEL